MRRCGIGRSRRPKCASGCRRSRVILRTCATNRSTLNTPEPSAARSRLSEQPSRGLISPLHQFDSIAERIVDKEAVMVFKGFVALDGVACGFKLAFEIFRIIDEERGMRLARRTGIRLDPKVHFERTAFEPAAPAFGEERRL